MKACIFVVTWDWEYVGASEYNCMCLTVCMGEGKTLCIVCKCLCLSEKNSMYSM